MFLGHMIRTRFRSEFCETSPQRLFHFQRCLYTFPLLNASVRPAPSRQGRSLRRGPISCAVPSIPLRISTSERQHVVSQAPARVLFCFPPLLVFNCCCGGQLILLPSFPPRSICSRTQQQRRRCWFALPSPPPPPNPTASL